MMVGVKVDDSDTRSFHAWVEHRGQALNDTRDVRERYIPFASALEAPPL